MSFLTDIITERNNVTVCPLRLLLIGGVIFYIGMEFRDSLTVVGYNFFGHAKDFATGLANLLGLGGCAVAGKSFSESQQ